MLPIGTRPCAKRGAKVLYGKNTTRTRFLERPTTFLAAKTTSNGPDEYLVPSQGVNARSEAVSSRREDAVEVFRGGAATRAAHRELATTWRDRRTRWRRHGGRTR